MAKFNDLIKEDPQKAAGIIQDAFLHVVNTMIPEIYLTKEEWHTVSKIIFSGQAQCPHEDAGSGDGGNTEGDNGTTDPGSVTPSGEDDVS